VRFADVGVALRRMMDPDSLRALATSACVPRPQRAMGATCPKLSRWRIRSTSAANSYGQDAILVDTLPRVGPGRGVEHGDAGVRAVVDNSNMRPCDLAISQLSR
jgi:hypothetical protein